MATKSVSRKLPARSPDGKPKAPKKLAPVTLPFIGDKLRKMPVGLDETRVHPALKEYFGYCLHKLAILMKKRMSQELSSETVCGYQLGLLTVIAKSEASNQLTLGEEMGIDKATMVKLIDQLEKEGIVAREPHPTDRRQKLIRLTKKGQDSLARLKRLAASLEHELMDTLSAADQAVLRRAIPELLETLMNLKEA